SALVVRRFAPKLPNLLIGMVVGSLAALGLGHYTDSIELVGEIPAQLPPFHLPEFSLATLRTLAPEAFAVALLGLIEAVSISRAIATRSNQRIDSNQEFIGQGLSNVVGSMFSSYAGSGSFTRSGINYAAGARTPMSAIFAAVMLMGIVLLVAPLTRYLPVAAMGGVILLVAWNLLDFHHIGNVLNFSRSETAILVTTFLCTLFLELEFAIYIGVLLSLVFFLAKTSTPSIPTLSVDVDEEAGTRKFVNIQGRTLKQCPQLKIIRIDMSVYFGSVTHIQQRLRTIAENERIHHILVIASAINFIDLAGAEMLISENNQLKKEGGGLYFAGLKPSVYHFAARSFFVSKIGPDRFFDTKAGAVSSIYRRLDRDICAKCQSLIFTECNE